jgi:Skp family chaperone for outer membrane proteins
VIGALLTFVVVLGAPPVPAKRPPSERLVYTVDLEHAVLATLEGKRIKAEFDEALEKVEAEVQQKESGVYLLRKELEKTGDPATRARYDSEVEAIDQLIAREEKRLDEAQEKRLEPILEAMRKIIADANRSHGKRALVVDDSEHPIINAKDACDATVWLVKAYESKKPDRIPEIDACRAHVFCWVEFERLMGAVDESKKASGRLDAYQKEKQSELDTKQNELKKMEVKLGARGSGRAEYERARIELAARYSAYQQALKEKERAEEKKVRDAAMALIMEAAAASPGALFVDGSLKTVDRSQPLTPSCDVNAWFIDFAHKTTRADDLLHACPAYDQGK